MRGIGIGMRRHGGVRLTGGGCTPVDQIDGSVVSGATFTHPADGVIAWTMTTFGSTNTDLLFRMQSYSPKNYWQTTVSPSGDFILYEWVAGAFTQRASVASVVADGHRCVVVFDGTTIRGYSNGALRWEYSSATNFATATDGMLEGAPLGGVVSDLKTWSLACRASEGV